jgi:4-amino-4-deoxy-L-arabinose transferase-like glycosyltransferase
MDPAQSLTPPRGRRLPLAFEVAAVTILALGLLVPGLWRYSLVDPWETHYAEVARRMLQDHDWVHTDWQNEGFRSKPVLTFWLMASSMRALGIGEDGGYAGEMTATPRVMLAVRLPFALFGVLGLVLTFYMLSRLVSRRVAWLSLLVVGTTPFFLFVARQGITDMTLVGCMMGALALFALATEDGERPIAPTWRIGSRTRPWSLGPLHLFAAVAGAIIVGQAAYYAHYFTVRPALAGGVRFPAPAIVIPVAMMVLTALLFSAPFRWLRLPQISRPLRSMRQVYLLWFYLLLGVSVLGKGLPALGIVGLVAFFYVALLGRWRDITAGRFEILRGVLLIAVIAVPWHVAMALKDHRFINEYFMTHLFNRAAVGVFGERGTFNFYLSQVGYGMFFWAALLPAAVTSFVHLCRPQTREGRVRFIVGVWAISTVAFFSVVQTKFHHYILPAVPALGLIVAFYLDDVWAGRLHHHWLYSALGAAIVLLLTRDMMHEEKQWIEMFVFRYDRPWPSSEPWAIDTSDAFLVLGLMGAAALWLLPVAQRIRWFGLGVAGVATAGVAIAMWAMHVYMPIAGTHWGMRDAAATYYRQRQIHGQRIEYHSAAQLTADWKGRTTWSFETVVPDHLQVGQPMTVRIELKSSVRGEKPLDVSLVGKVEAGGDHRVELRFPSQEVAKLAPTFVTAGTTSPTGVAPPRKLVDGDRLIAWQLYWRGENFWSGDEIWGPVPEMKTALVKTDNVEFLKYLNDRALCPVGRTYYVLTEAGRLPGLRNLLPTASAKETFEILDTTSNKFSLGSFVL